MSTFLKTVIIFFTIILSFIGINIDSFHSLLGTPVQQTISSGTSPSFSVKKINFFYQHRQTENIINPVNYFPIPDLTNSLQAISGYILANEAKIGNILACYFAYSLTIFRGLSAFDIVFPFHYFY